MFGEVISRHVIGPARCMQEVFGCVYQALIGLWQHKVGLFRVAMVVGLVVPSQTGQAMGQQH